MTCEGDNEPAEQAEAMVIRMVAGDRAANDHAFERIKHGSLHVLTGLAAGLRGGRSLSRARFAPIEWVPRSAFGGFSSYDDALPSPARQAAARAAGLE